MRTLIPKLRPYRILFASLALAGYASPINSLSIRKDFTHGSHPGYIDAAIAVVEPKAGFASVSLFLTYSDHGQFPGSLVEVVHSFGLPEGAKVNDLWLWIGDSIMQARAYELPKAQHLYDSITAFKRDPAFLKKSQGQYELHIFPLSSGGTRKVKITMQIPIVWNGLEPRIPLPLGLLQSNNSRSKPLEILLRTGAFQFRNPVMLGAMDFPFVRRPDTLGYQYRSASLTDVTGMDRLDLAFLPEFPDGFTAQTDTGGLGGLFSFAFEPKSFFSLPKRDDSPLRSIIGLDLSGHLDPDPSEFPARLGELLRTTVRIQDSVRLVVTGAGKSEAFPASGWSGAGQGDLDALVSQFRNGGISTARKAWQAPRLLLTDIEAQHCWGFTGMEKVARSTLLNATGGIKNAVGRFRESDLVASYGQGFEDKLTDTDAALVIDSLNAFFDRGGWFLTYIDFNRGNEKIARHYIKGLQIPKAFQKSTLSGIPGTVVGKGLPASMYHQTHNPLITEDGEVVVEMVDEKKAPIVISKRIRNGRLVVSGIWSNNDADGIKKSMSQAMLGIQSHDAKSQLPDLLAKVAASHGQGKADRILIGSSSDSVYPIDAAKSATLDFFTKLGADAPGVDAINLLSGQSHIPPMLVAGGESHPGSGYLLHSLAEAGGGQYRSLYSQGWPQIVEAFHASNEYAPLSLDFHVVPDVPGTKTSWEISPIPGDASKPRCFIGTGAPTDGSLRLDLKARFRGLDSVYSRSVSLEIRKDSTGFGSELGTMLAGEMIQEAMRMAKVDTARIVALALRHRMVTDFTALLALEPNDTLKFMAKPKDESVIAPVTAVTSAPMVNDSLGVAAFFSKSDNQWHFKFAVPSQGKLEMAIYDASGRQVFGMNQIVSSKGTFGIPGNSAGLDALAKQRFAVAFVRFSGRNPQHAKKDWVKIVRLTR